MTSNTKNIQQIGAVIDNIESKLYEQYEDSENIILETELIDSILSINQTKRKRILKNFRQISSFNLQRNHKLS